MKISYAKFTMNMELDFTHGRIGNVEGRATLFKAIIDAGWDLTLSSQVSTHDEEVIYNKNFENEYGIDNRWIESIHYKPDAPVDSDTDLLIIENGPDNLLYRTRYNQQTFVRRCAEIMDSYKGLVFILGIHPDVPFPLAKMAHCKVGYDSKHNIYRQGKGSDVDHGWASYDEIHKDKKLIFLNQAHNQEKYLDYFDKKRQGYREHNVKFYRLPILYGKWLIPKKFRKEPFTNQNIYDLVYLGYPRYREKEWNHFMKPLGKKFEVHTWGPWHKKANLAFRDETERSEWNIHDFLPAQVMCIDKYRHSFLSLGLISKKLQECGWVTHRTLETIHSGCILLGINQAFGINHYLDEKFLITEPEEISDWIDFMKKTSHKKRKRLWEQQFEKIKKYDGKHMLKYFMKIYRREKC